MGVDFHHQDSAAAEEIRLLTARLNRAADLHGEFAAAWQAYLDRRPHDLFHTIEADGSTASRLRRVEPIPAELSLILGEFLYEMRAALDNCLYAVAVITSGQNPPPAAEKLEWPIRATAQEWKNQRKRLDHLPGRIVEQLEAIQPYQAAVPSWNSLGILHDLARFDRHRAPRTLALYLVEVRLWAKPTDITIIDPGSEGIVKDGETLIQYRLRDGATLSPESFDLRVEFDVDVEDVHIGPGPRGSSGRPWGSLAQRLRSVHQAASGYCEGLLQSAAECSTED